MPTVTLRRTTVDEIEVHMDDPAGNVVDITARALDLIRAARRIGPRSAPRKIEAAPLEITSQRAV
jgi:hypothetical protein